MTTRDERERERERKKDIVEFGNSNSSDILDDVKLFVAMCDDC